MNTLDTVVLLGGPIGVTAIGMYVLVGFVRSRQRVSEEIALEPVYEESGQQTLWGLSAIKKTRLSLYPEFFVHSAGGKKTIASWNTVTKLTGSKFLWGDQVTVVIKPTPSINETTLTFVSYEGTGMFDSMSNILREAKSEAQIKRIGRR